MAAESITTNDYAAFIADLKVDIARSRVKAALAVNRELVLLYWRIGSGILAKQNELGWGAKVVDQISVDLRLEFPGMKGLSRTNLLYMRSFANAYPDYEIIQQAAGQDFANSPATRWIKVVAAIVQQFAAQIRKYAAACCTNSIRAAVCPHLTRSKWS